MIIHDNSGYRTYVGYMTAGMVFYMKPEGKLASTSGYWLGCFNEGSGSSDVQYKDFGFDLENRKFYLMETYFDHSKKVRKFETVKMDLHLNQSYDFGPSTPNETLYKSIFTIDRKLYMGAKTALSSKDTVRDYIVDLKTGIMREWPSGDHNVITFKNADIIIS